MVHQQITFDELPFRQRPRLRIFLLLLLVGLDDRLQKYSQKWWLTVPNVPFFRKTVVVFNVLSDHIFWPVNWFIITIAANVIAVINPVYARTTLGYMVPQLAGFILSSCLIALLCMLYLDYKNRPDNQSLPWYRRSWS